MTGDDLYCFIRYGLALLKMSVINRDEWDSGLGMTDRDCDCVRAFCFSW